MVALTALRPTARETRLLQLVSADEYRDLPDDGNRYELVRGDMVVAPTPRRKHQQIALELAYGLNAFVIKRGFGWAFIAPFDVYLNTYEVYQPDIVVILKANASRLTEDGMYGPPDLVVEILSPTNRKQDLVVKATECAKSGVPEYWVIDPDVDRIEVNRLHEGALEALPQKGRFIRSSIVRGFKIASSQIFTMPAWMTQPAPSAAHEEG